MTARDDAIESIVESFRAQHERFNVYDAIRETLEAAGYKPLFEFILDAIPPRVLAQLAIDTGALVEDGRQVLTHTETLPNGRIRNRFAPLYRLAEDGGPGDS